MPKGKLMHTKQHYKGKNKVIPVVSSGVNHRGPTSAMLRKLVQATELSISRR